MDWSKLCAALLEVAPDAIVVTNTSGQMILVNEQAERLFGIPRAELVGSTIETLLPARLREHHVQVRQQYGEAPRLRQMGSGLEVTAQHRDGREFPAEISLSPLVIDNETFVIAIVRDISDRHEAATKLRFLSTHDTLTGLPNRVFFDEELRRVGEAGRFPVSTMMIDIDGLKAANDTRGHEAGDALLVRAGNLFRTIFRGSDTVARVGGDEFAAILPETNEAACTQIVARLRAQADAHNSQHELTEQVWFSVGWSVATSQTELSGSLRAADEAMYQDKRARRPSLPPELLRKLSGLMPGR